MVHACSLHSESAWTVNRFWIPQLESLPGMSVSLWRKSSPWLSLIRPHAQLVADDETMHRYFRQSPMQEEHYIPTLLAWKSKGDDNALSTSTTCIGTFAYWSFKTSRAQVFSPDDIQPELFLRLRSEGHCSGTRLCHYTAMRFSAQTADIIMQKQNIGMMIL